MHRILSLVLLSAFLLLPADLAHAKVDPDKLTVAQKQQLLVIGHKLAGAYDLAT